MPPSPSPAPAGSAAPVVASQPASAATPITVAYSQTSASFLPNFIADDAGIFQANGLAANLSLSESSTAMASLLSGQIQVAETGGLELVNAVAAGADLVAVTCLVPVYPYRLEVLNSIQSPQDLVGAKIGITNFGSTIDLATRLAVSRLGLDPTKDVTLIPVTSVSARTAAMLSGAIQAGLSQPPEWLSLEAQGFHPLFDLAAAGIPAAVVTGIVQRSFLNANRDIVQRFVDSLVQAVARERRDQQFAVLELQKIFGAIDPAALDETYQYYSTNVHPSLPYPATDQLAEAVSALAVQNPSASNMNVDSIIDRSFVQSAADRGLQNS